MSQKTRILELLRAYPEGLTCARLASEGLFHKGASRMSDLRKLGCVIEFEAGETWDKGTYRLVSEEVGIPRLGGETPPKFELEGEQFVMFKEAVNG